MKVGIGHSEAVETIEAIQEVIGQCKEGLGTSKPDVAILFSAICYEYSEILENVQKAFPDIQLIGCTTDGEVSSINSFLEDSLVLMCISSDKIQFSSGSGTNISVDHKAAIKSALDEAKKGLDSEPKLCITFFDGITANGTDVIDSLQEQLGEDVFVYGGTAGDQWEMKQTNQFHNDASLSDAITVLLISGDVNFSTGVSTGRVPFGKKFNITKVDKNIVYEIDNMPAVEFYEKYVGTYNRASTETPLAVLTEGGDDFYLRAPFALHEDGSISFAANVPEGATVQLTNENKEGIVQAAEIASEAAIKEYEGENIDLVLITSCAGRKLVLGSRTSEEIELLKSVVPPETVIGGFYSYGEICPLLNSGKTKFHNNTIVLLFIGEK